MPASGRSATSWMNLSTSRGRKPPGSGQPVPGTKAASRQSTSKLSQTASRVPRGEGLGPLEITITPPADVDVDTAARYAALGVDRLNLQLPWETTTADDLDRYFERVVHPLVEAER